MCQSSFDATAADAASAKAEIRDLTVCIVLTGERFQSHTVTLT